MAPIVWLITDVVNVVTYNENIIMCFISIISISLAISSNTFSFIVVFIQFIIETINYAPTVRYYTYLVVTLVKLYIVEKIIYGI